ncbi:MULTISPECIES: ferric reductase-like transmembrane domain-containing protein [Microbacterium]|uniref:Ferric reductase-like transmembrane domain-containing protein n=1 Tax=Microbacterium marmarense TaxID=3122051 RepID=A0ABU8LT96_9MICO
MHHPVRAALWVLAYLLIALAPLALSLIQLDPGRGFWVNLSVAAGFVGLSLMGLQFVIAARSVHVTGLFGPDVLLRVHRQITALIAVLIFAHPIILFVWDARFLALLNPFTSPPRAKFAVASVVLLSILIITSVWRRRLKIPYQTWQVLHSVLAVLVVVTGVAHVLLIGYYVSEPWERALWVVYSAVFIWIGLWVRVIRPLSRWRRRWRVVHVRPQPLGSHTVRLEPVSSDSYGRQGFSFSAGQYAWIQTGRNPFSINYHPFSFSSSAENPQSVEFTIKTEHGFTARVGELEPGAIVYLDGPWGQLTMDDNEGPGFVFIAAGVGVTPMLSMLTTMADRGDHRPCWLILGNRNESEVICSAEVNQLNERMANLTVVQTISQPGTNWNGRAGRISRELLDEVLPENRARMQYFMCAAGPVMDTAQSALVELGVPVARIHSERFAMA